MGHGDRHDDEPLDEGRDEPSDERRGGSPPHPMDRVWLHPSELPADAIAPRAPRPKGRYSRLLVPAVAGAIGAVATVAILALTGTLNRTTTTTSPASIPAATATGPAVAANATTIGLSMVAITARDSTGTRRGSGVCVRHGSEVLTSAHLIGNATQIQVLTADGQLHPAHVAGRDRTTDLALLAIDATVPAAELADTTPAAGSTVWIVGATEAGSSMPWMSSGLLSSSDAVVTAPQGPWTGGLYETDAASNTPAVGAALIDQSGAVVGIVLGRVGDGTTSYAVPIKEAVNVGEQLHATGKAKHGSLGFDGADGAYGPTVTALIEGGPAAGAGLHVGDIVQSVNSREVQTVNDMLAVVRSNDPGSVVTLQLRRGARSFKVSMKAAAITG